MSAITAQSYNTSFLSSIRSQLAAVRDAQNAAPSDNIPASSGHTLGEDTLFLSQEALAVSFVGRSDIRQVASIPADTFAKPQSEVMQQAIQAAADKRTFLAEREARRETLAKSPEEAIARSRMMFGSSKHLSITRWALGFEDAFNNFGAVNLTAGQTKTEKESLYAQSQTRLESIDEKIGKLLSENHVVLSDEETLNLSVNQDGVITVGDGIKDPAKREAIESALNADESLGHELLMAHAVRNHADGGYDKNNRQIFLNEILRKEYGVTLDEFELAEFDDVSQSEFTQLKSKSGDAGLVMKIFDEEGMLCNDIQTYLKNKTESPESTEFNVSFSYKNGVTVEDGKTDREGLNEVAANALKRSIFPTAEDEDYTVTVNSDGIMTDAQVMRTLFRDWVRQMNISSLDEKTYNMNSRDFSQQFLQQYLIDQQRLIRFDTGISKESVDQMQITFGKVGGKAFSVSVSG
jgi:hypothetical protein